MVVLGAFAPESCDFATRSQIIGAKFVNGHINYQLEHFSNFSNFLKKNCLLLYLIVPENVSESAHFSIFFWGSKQSEQCVCGKILPMWCPRRDLFAPKF